MKQKYCVNRPGKRSRFKRRNHRASANFGGLYRRNDDFLTKLIAQSIIQSTIRKFGF